MDLYLKLKLCSRTFSRKQTNCATARLQSTPSPPGPVGTGLFLDGKTPGQIAQIGKLAPLERLGGPEDIANVVSFLAGPDSGFAWPLFATKPAFTSP